MDQEERYHVLQVLEKISKQIKINEKFIEELQEIQISYDFFEDMFEIINEFCFDEHLLYLRISALLEQCIKNNEEI